MRGLRVHLWSAVLTLAASAAFVAGCSSVASQQGRKSAPLQAPSPSASARPSPTPFEGATIERPTSEPYTGDLSIFEDSRRAENLQVERVMDVLKIHEGSSVADIGAGSGWFTVRAARRVGERGTVFAVDINADFLKHIDARAASQKLTNVRTVLGKEDDPLLPEKSIDAVLLLKTYHEVAQPVRLLAHLRRSLRDGALVGIIDRNGRGDDHGVERETVVAEAAQAGFSLVEEHDFVKPDRMDYFLVFRALK